MSTIILRYFPVQGRVQALRHALADAGVEHEDVQVPMDQWPSKKQDASFAGPFGGLPTLSWDGRLISETLPIASFLAKRLGHYEGMDDITAAHHESIVSNCYVEGILRIGELIWSDMLYPGIDSSKVLPAFFGRVADKLKRLEAIAPESGFLGGHRPLMSDFFAAGTLHALRYTLGPARDAALQAQMPRLFAISSALEQRPALSAAIKNRPAHFTAHPNEPAAVEKLRALDLSSLGL